MNNNCELIVCIVNSGFSDEVMEHVRKNGARGGTVINARGTGRVEAEKLFGITVQPEKEIILTVVDKSVKDNILHAIYTNVGLDSPGQGIAFTVPVDDVVGLVLDK